jgi:hypothetical protein
LSFPLLVPIQDRMRDERGRYLLSAAWPALTLASLIPFLVAGPPKWGCGDREPFGQAEAVADFRLVALPVTALSAILAVGLVALLSGRPARARASRRTWAGFVLLAAVLATRLGRAWLGLAGAIAVEAWPITLGCVLLLAGMLFVGARTVAASGDRVEGVRDWSRFHSIVGWTVLALLAAIFVAALGHDGGPLYC